MARGLEALMALREEEVGKEGDGEDPMPEPRPEPMAPGSNATMNEVIYMLSEMMTRSDADTNPAVSAY